MFAFRCPLRWSDLDAQGHVNNAVLVDHLQEARVAFFHDGPASELLDSGVVVVGHQMEYLASVDYTPEPLEIDLDVASVGGARFEIAYRLRQHGRDVARARTVLCPFDFALGRPVRLPGEVRRHLEAHLADVEPLRPLVAPPLEGAGTPTPLFVRWSDLDSYGHVNNSVAYDYIQQARITATSSWDPTMTRVGGADAPYLWLVARQDVDYLAQMSHRTAPYVALTAPVRLGSTSVTLACEIVDPDTGQVITRGRTVLVCADATFRPTPLPDSTRAAVESKLIG